MVAQTDRGQDPSERPRGWRSPGTGESAGRADTTFRYDAFLSYSHAADRSTSIAVQKVLQALRRRFLGPPALRVFRDDTSLSANPDLWAGIVRALASSRFFILLACPESAASEWVAREVSWWLKHRGPLTLFIALTNGEIVWGGRDFTYPTNALRPASFSRVYQQEPLWVDLRFARGRADLDRDDPALCDAVATLAAPMHGLTKDELESADLRAQRRGRRLRGYALATVSLLLVVAVILGLTTYQQLTESRRQTAIATARAFAAEADGVAARDPQLSAHLALAAYRLDPSAEAMTALMHAEERTGSTDAFLEVEAGRSAPDDHVFAGAEGITLDSSADGRLVAVGAFGGGVRVWDRSTGREVGVYPSEGSGNAGTPGDLSDDGRRLTTFDAILNIPDGSPAYVPPADTTLDGSSSDGRFIGLASTDRSSGYVVDLQSADRSAVLVAQTAPGQVDGPLAAALATSNERAYEQLRGTLFGGGEAYTALAKHAGRWLALVGGTDVQTRDLDTGAVLASAPLAQGAGHGDAIGVSTDGTAVVVGDDEGRVTAFDGDLGAQRLITQMPGQIKTITVTADGSAATVLDSRGNVTALRLNGTGAMSVLPGTPGRYSPADVEAPVLTPSPDGRLLLIGSSNGVELWSLAEQRKVADVPVEPPLFVDPDPVLAFDASGARFAVRGVAGLHLFDTAGLREVDRRPPPPPGTAGAALSDLLGAGAYAARSDVSPDPAAPVLSPTGRTEVLNHQVIDVGSGASVPLSGGTGRGSSSFYGFAADDAVVVESVVPDRESQVFRNRLQLWHRATGTLIGEFDEPLTVTFPGEQSGGIAVAGGTSALTVRPDGGIGQWTVSPQAWTQHLCVVAGEPSSQERSQHFAILEGKPLCSGD